jgi:hypothetical protein
MPDQRLSDVRVRGALFDAAKSGKIQRRQKADDCWFMTD